MHQCPVCLNDEPVLIVCGKCCDGGCCQHCLIQLKCRQAWWPGGCECAVCYSSRLPLLCPVCRQRWAHAEINTLIKHELETFADEYYDDDPIDDHYKCDSYLTQKWRIEARRQTPLFRRLFNNHLMSEEFIDRRDKMLAQRAMVHPLCFQVQLYWEDNPGH